MAVISVARQPLFHFRFPHCCYENVDVLNNIELLTSSIIIISGYEIAVFVVLGVCCLSQGELPSGDCYVN
jgi:hypothetical protein